MRPPHNRKLLQLASWSSNINSNSQQIAAAQVARVITQQQIARAVDDDDPNTQFAATSAATTVGQIGTTLVATDPCALAWTAACGLQRAGRRH
jgi:hypothetical protein